jgi:hypothetical protein
MMNANPENAEATESVNERRRTSPSSPADFRAAEAITTRLVAKQIPELKKTTDATTRIV